MRTAKNINKMRLSGLALASLACGIVAADYKTVLADIAQISNATKLLDFDVGFVTAGIPGFPFALQVQVDAVGLRKCHPFHPREKMNRIICSDRAHRKSIY